MTEREAIKKHIDECSNRIENISFFMDSNSDYNKEECCNNIQILQKVINALKKQIAKKPINNKHTVSVSSTAVKVVDWWKCGKCNGDLTRQLAFCPYCQTVIDWSDEE